MDDRITQLLTTHRDQLASGLAMMESGALRTHMNHRDTTDESIAQYREWIAEIEAALARHEARHA